MKRDMDLVRRILSEVSDSANPLDADAFTCSAASRELVGYHFEIMQQAGLLDATVKKAWGGEYILATADSLTWDGNDFLDAVRSDTVWQKVKMTVAKTTSSASFDVIKALAVKLATEALLR